MIASAHRLIYYTFLNETAMRKAWRKESTENEFIERKWLIVIMGNDVIFLKTWFWYIIMKECHYEKNSISVSRSPLS